MTCFIKDKFLILTLLLVFVVPVARSWPACSGNWISVPAGTSSANGAIVTENGQTFQCQPITPPTSTGNTNTNTNTNNNSSSSTSSSKSSSSSTATGGNSSSNSTVGPISNTNTATGGSLTNSGNSSNKNVNTANGGQGGTSNATATGGNQSQTANATNNSSGNSTSINDTSTYNEAKIPVNTAYAAAPYPTAQCFKGGGIGGQAGVFGLSLNGGKIDENCARLETARSFDAVGERLAACKVKVSNKYAKEAGVTLADCLKVPDPAPVVITAPPVTPTPTPVIVNLPAPVVNVLPTPVYVDQTPAYVPQPVYKAPHKKIKKPIGTIKPCPDTTKGNNEKANCWEN